MAPFGSMLSGWFLPAIAVLAALGGLLLLLTGLFPKRTGSTPYCRKCRYNLTGLDRAGEGARCPECGAYLAQPKAMIIGERRVRHRSIGAGVICSLLSVVVLGWLGYGAARRIRWYSHYPTSWVLRDFTNANPMGALRAWSELTARLERGALNEHQISRLIELCLGEQARPGVRPYVGDAPIQLLGQFYQAARLSEAQRTALFENCCRMSASVRPTVLFGYPCPAKLECYPRFPPGLHGDFSVLQRAGEPIGERRVFATTLAGVITTLDLNLPFVGLPVGKARVALIAHLDIYDDRAAPDSKPSWSLRKEFGLETVFWGKNLPATLC